MGRRSASWIILAAGGIGLLVYLGLYWRKLPPPGDEGGAREVALRIVGIPTGVHIRNFIGEVGAGTHFSGSGLTAGLAIILEPTLRSTEVMGWNGPLSDPFEGPKPADPVYVDWLGWHNGVGDVTRIRRVGVVGEDASRTWHVWWFPEEELEAQRAIAATTGLLFDFSTAKAADFIPASIILGQLNQTNNVGVRVIPLEKGASRASVVEWLRAKSSWLADRASIEDEQNLRKTADDMKLVCVRVAGAQPPPEPAVASVLADMEEDLGRISQLASAISAQAWPRDYAPLKSLANDICALAQKLPKP